MGYNRTAADRQRGYVVWVVLLVLAFAVVGAWRYSEYRSAQRLTARQAEEAADKKAQQTRADQERKAVEERLAEEKRQRNALTESLKTVDALVSRWGDASKVASTTSRISLSGPVGNLQALKREAEQLTVPPCLDGGRIELVKAMQSTVDGFLVFMRNEYKLGDALSSSYFEESKLAMNSYQEARSACPSQADQ